MNKLLTVLGREVTCSDVPFRERNLSALWGMDWRQ